MIWQQEGSRFLTFKIGVSEATLACSLNFSRRVHWLLQRSEPRKRRCQDVRPKKILALALVICLSKGVTQLRSGKLFARFQNLTCY
jgi:hypothetical protein